VIEGIIMLYLINFNSFPRLVILTVIPILFRNSFISLQLTFIIYKLISCIFQVRVFMCCVKIDNQRQYDFFLHLNWYMFVFLKMK